MISGEWKKKTGKKDRADGKVTTERETASGSVTQ